MDTLCCNEPHRAPRVASLATAAGPEVTPSRPGAPDSHTRQQQQGALLHARHEGE